MQRTTEVTYMTAAGVHHTTTLDGTRDASAAPAPDYPVLRLDTQILDIRPDRTSSNGTPYCAVVIPSDQPDTQDEWVFCWAGTGDWKQELEHNADAYIGLDVRLWVRDKEDTPDDHFYNLEAVAPADPTVAGAFLDRQIRDAGADPDAMTSDVTHEEAAAFYDRPPLYCPDCETWRIRVGRDVWACPDCGR